MSVKGACTSKYMTGSGAVTTVGRPGWLCSYCFEVGQTDSTVIFSDNGTSGTARWKDGNNAVTAAGDLYIRHTFSPPIYFPTDIYATVANIAELSVAYIEDLATITAM